MDGGSCETTNSSPKVRSRYTPDQSIGSSPIVRSSGPDQSIGSSPIVRSSGPDQSIGSSPIVRSSGPDQSIGSVSRSDSRIRYFTSTDPTSRKVPLQIPESFFPHCTSFPKSRKPFWTSLEVLPDPHLEFSI